jgi:Winged helix-turn helix
VFLLLVSIWEGFIAALEIRKDRTPTVLRKLAKETHDARVARRILAIANARDGMSREDAARSAGMDRQTLRDWVLRYNAQGVGSSASMSASVMACGNFSKMWRRYS